MKSLHRSRYIKPCISWQPSFTSRSSPRNKDFTKIKMVRLTKEQVEFFKENGFIKLSNVFTQKELEEIQAEYIRLFEMKNKHGVEAKWKGELVEKEAGSKDYSVQSIHNLQFHSAVFSRLLHNESLLEAFEDVMGTPNILLHHTKAHLKPPKIGAPYLMHQDYPYFPFKKHSMIAAFMHINKADPANGGLCVYPGSHKLGPLEDFGSYVENEHFHYVDPSKYPVEKATPITGEPGDVVIFSYLLLHGSYMNKSDRPRMMFLMQLMAAEDEPVDDQHKSPGQGWVLRGRNDNRKATFAERHLH